MTFPELTVWILGLVAGGLFGFLGTLFWVAPRLIREADAWKRAFHAKAEESSAHADEALRLYTELKQFADLQNRAGEP